LIGDKQQSYEKKVEDIWWSKFCGTMQKASKEAIWLVNII
jgi:hypothetical protein